MSSLNDYLKTMKIKRRAMGGLDEEDVLSHIKEIRGLVQDELDARDAEIRDIQEQLSARDAKIREAQEQLGERDAQIRNVQSKLDKAHEELNRYQTSYQAVRDSNSQLDEWIKQLGEEPGRYQEARGRAEEARQRYDEKHQELVVAVKVLNNLKEDTERKVRAEVRESLKEDEQRARAAMNARIEEERRSARVEIDRLNSEIATLQDQRQKLADSLRTRREQLNRQLSWINDQLATDWEQADHSSLTDKDDFIF